MSPNQIIISSFSMLAMLKVAGYYIEIQNQDTVLEQNNFTLNSISYFA